MHFTFRTRLDLINIGEKGASQAAWTSINENKFPSGICYRTWFRLNETKGIHHTTYNGTEEQHKILYENLKIALKYNKDETREEVVKLIIRNCSATRADFSEFAAADNSLIALESMLGDKKISDAIIALNDKLQDINAKDPLWWSFVNYAYRDQLNPGLGEVDNRNKLLRMNDTVRGYALENPLVSYRNFWPGSESYGKVEGRIKSGKLGLLDIKAALALPTKNAITAIEMERRHADELFGNRTVFESFFEDKEHYKFLIDRIMELPGPINPDSLLQALNMLKEHIKPKAPPPRPPINDMIKNIMTMSITEVYETFNSKRRTPPQINDAWPVDSSYTSLSFNSFVSAFPKLWTEGELRDVTLFRRELMAWFRYSDIQNHQGIDVIPDYKDRIIAMTNAQLVNVFGWLQSESFIRIDIRLIWPVLSGEYSVDDFLAAKKAFIFKYGKFNPELFRIAFRHWFVMGGEPLPAVRERNLPSDFDATKFINLVMNTPDEELKNQFRNRGDRCEDNWPSHREPYYWNTFYCKTPGDVFSFYQGGILDVLKFRKMVKTFFDPLDILYPNVQPRLVPSEAPRLPQMVAQHQEATRQAADKTKAVFVDEIAAIFDQPIMKPAIGRVDEFIGHQAEKKKELTTDEWIASMVELAKTIK